MTCTLTPPIFLILLAYLKKNPKYIGRVFKHADPEMLKTVSITEISFPADMKKISAKFLLTDEEMEEYFDICITLNERGFVEECIMENVVDSNDVCVFDRQETLDMLSPFFVESQELRDAVKAFDDLRTSLNREE